MKRVHAIGSVLQAAALLLCLAAAPAPAAQPHAAATRLSVTHRPPDSPTRASLQAFLDAQISHADIGLFSFPGCFYVEDNSLVTIGQDYRGGRYMHMVRAQARSIFGAVDGYTFSAGLYTLPVRSTPLHLNPFY